ncbi:sugar phosphate isomerase/epimerase family protein [Haladaptatus pallidirubidus]|uniref:Xylose isomerase-like TIM barrel domain-containing protein n=1 Tax=Haladaptatus pallidirubidus TaxID=1008152 RepID=A0AAV3UJ46_9EURY|nr:sugar phosphate isomerase/epimerase [Haladaptatus pallidirubidus]
MVQKSDDQKMTDNKFFNVNRRRVLQGIGAAGVGTAITSTAWQAKTTVAAQETDDDIPISTQFYSYRDTGLSVPELIQKAAAAGYDAFEPYSVGANTNVNPILQAMDDTGLEMSSAHISISAVEDNTEAMANTFSQFGTPTLIDPGAGPDDWGDEAAVIDFAERCNAAADLLAEYNLEFGHHNHDSEFTEIGDTTGYDIFAKNLDDQVQIQLDVGWALVGGRDPISFTVDHSTNVRSLHMKNMTVDPQEFTEIHEGDVNMRAVATAFRNTGDTDYLVFEHDAPGNPLESMQIGANWLEKLNQPWQPGGICAIEGADTHPAKLYSP